MMHGTSHVRWWICALLFLATTINYIDRQVFSILAPDLQRSVGWNEVEYGYIVTAFQAAYALGLAVSGRLMDTLGTRAGFSLIIALWSLAAMGTGLARSALQFGMARFALGLGEGGNFPGAIKTVAEWFPKRERALATGIFNAGTNVGAIVAPMVVPWIALHYGWPWAFILTGVVGFLWLVVWWASYRRPEAHPAVSPAELKHIQSDPPDAQAAVNWRVLLPIRSTWAFAIGKFLTDPVWWFYLFWLPKFLNAKYGLGLQQIGLPLIVVYVAADIGSIGGGWLSSSLIARGWALNRARKTAMLICAISVVPIMLASATSSLWLSVALFGLATAAHQGWSANLFTLTSDIFPRHAVGSVVGIGGAAGAVGGMIVSTSAGHILEWTGSYTPMVIWAGSMYLLALLIIHWLVPRIAPVALEELNVSRRTPGSGV